MVAFPSASVTALPREFSDHSTIILRNSYMDFGTPLFRLFNYWLFRGDFDYVVKQAWDGFNGGGSVDRYLFGKLIFQRFYKSIETYGVRKENKEFIDLKNN